jgi:23S rRNA (cytosine1962-C5)-methyltransferase
VWEFGREIQNPQPETVVQVLHHRILNAFQRRIANQDLTLTNSYRIINAESDLVPGLIVDRYDDVLVVQVLSCGPEKYRLEIGDILFDVTGVKTIYERSDTEVRNLEGLAERKGLLRGDKTNTEQIIKENGLKFKIDIFSGQKTGFYLDQRTNRSLLREYASGNEILDCFCYSGGFTLNALNGNASNVTALDVSKPSLELLKENLSLNNLPMEKVEIIQNDVFKQLRRFRDQGRSFDVIVLDPPKFAPTKKQISSASRGYKDINLWAMRLLKPGGSLFTFSCSGGIDTGLFQKIVAGAAEDSEVEIQIISKLTQASDHPVLLSFPEGEYLKGLICQRI